MDHMQKYAYEPALRASSFAALGIFCLMFGTSYDLHLAFMLGAVLASAWTLALVYKAREARTKNYRKTELWLRLPKPLRPPEAVAQRISATILRETYLRVASWSAAIAAILWAGALGASLFGR